MQQTGRRIGVIFIDGIHRNYLNFPKLTRLMSTTLKSKSLMYKDYGEPADVVQITEECLPKCGNDQVSHFLFYCLFLLCINFFLNNFTFITQVLVKWIYAPVNPADINTIQGKYPSKPPLPAVPGNEGVGEIVATGCNTNQFSVGDKVVPNGVNKGTWRTHGIYKAQDLFKINECMDTVEASMLNVNPCTAYRMLKDFVQLKPGDTVIQNGGNSAVGQLVIQLCRIWGFKSVNVIRNRPEVQQLKDQLTNLGADVVLTEEELRTTEIFKSKKLPKPQLALNCVCGKSALEVQRHLGHSGVMVTYGGMSREPLTIPASSLIFKNIAFKGFWMTAWTNQNGDSEERCKMFDELQQLFIKKELKAPPYELVPLVNYKEAVTNALKPGGGKNVKYVLDLTC
ncbi:unnamed protein product [Trichogramma brassicae]|uniref:Enoyl-[acyl-carrier-protein] reductase, mitochondrial n=1 Tax=Trichogramma brassicae TaxID=86971 RepID=A0A6H5ISG9_9HYME|nr:unnamed protein product [Trichogramma brassicae]